MVRGALGVGVDGSLRAHEADVRFAGDDRGHRLICTKSAHKRQVDPFLFKIPFFDRRIHRCVEDRMRDLIQCDLRKFFLLCFF